MNLPASRSKLFDRLGITPAQLAKFCQQWHLAELSLFGSILRDDFRPDSDIDILIVLDSDPNLHTSLMDLVGMQHQLEEMVGRKVDLIEKESVETSHNWIRRNSILNTAQIIYESGRILSA
jgi:predicted nucleotidyltransferase